MHNNTTGAAYGMGANQRSQDYVAPQNGQIAPSLPEIESLVAWSGKQEQMLSELLCDVEASLSRITGPVPDHEACAPPVGPGQIGALRRTLDAKELCIARLAAVSKRLAAL